MWALGISAIEMAEIKPPRWAVHPMRVIFMISREPPPRLTDDTRWSLTLQNFVATCLQKVRQARELKELKHREKPDIWAGIRAALNTTGSFDVAGWNTVCVPTVSHKAY